MHAVKIISKKLQVLLAFGFIIFTSSFCFSQTLFDPPKLNCVKNAGGFVELYWDIPASRPCFDSYEIYYSVGNQNGPYSFLIAVTDPLQNNISVNVALADSAYFYIVQRGTCVNPTPPSPLTSDTLNNITPQPFTELVNVTVIGGQVHVNWVAAKSPEVVAYLIFNDANGFSSADTVWGRLTTTYIDPAANPTNRAYQYKIRSLEYCEDPAGREGAITPDSADHRSVLLLTNTPDACTQTVSVSWQPYKYRNTSVINYEIEMSVDGGAFTTAGTAAADATSFLIQNIPSRVNICVRLKVNLPNDTSAYSNERCFMSDVIASPKNDYIRNVTVVGNNVIVHYVVDTAASPFRNIILHRSTDGLLFNPLTTQPPDSINFYTLEFEDGSANPGERVVHYRVQVNDSCANLHYSDTATALYLNVKEITGNRADMQWRGFDIDNEDFQQFRLEKIVGDDTTTLGLFNRSESSFRLDDLFDYSVDTLEDICFRITAEFYNLNDRAPRELLFSHSNMVCLAPKPKFFIPNAFAPGSDIVENKTIKPFLLLARDEGYEFIIFNRWHQTVFKTNDVNEGWDGTDKVRDADAPFDGYLFYCEYQGKDGATYTQTGTIMLIR